MSEQLVPGEIYRLITLGAHDAEDGEHYGVEGQLLRCINRLDDGEEDEAGDFKLLTPRPGQYKEEFYLLAEQLEKL